MSCFSRRNMVNHEKYGKRVVSKATTRNTHVNVILIYYNKILL